MLKAYCLDQNVGTMSPIQFTNLSVQKGSTAVLQTPGSIALNKCGVYMIAANASSAAASTIQLMVNGVAQLGAQATGTSPAFVDLVQVDHNNTNCCCSSPTIIQVINSGTAAADLTNASIAITKVC